MVAADSSSPLALLIEHEKRATCAVVVCRALEKFREAREFLFADPRLAPVLEIGEIDVRR